MLHRLTSSDLRTLARSPLDPATLTHAATIVEDVRTRGAAAVREHAERLGDIASGQSVVIERPELERARNAIDEAHLALLERTADRIRRFATAQRDCLLPLSTEVPGGRAGHRFVPTRSAGCYAPGGRYPLPSSVLMTVIPAAVAGVESITVATPRPAEVMLAAAAVAGADRVLAVGGAQAIAALAFGAYGPRADVIVGPGNRWVTAAKKHLAGEVGIDGLAGPSELVVLADGSADPAVVAADLLGQAEHDSDASAMVVSPDRALLDAVDEALHDQLRDLATASTARAALAGQGCAVLVADLDEAVDVVNRIAPEHLELCVEDPHALVERLTAYGGLFIGEGSAEVFGDYGAGPNHVLPTGRGSRFQAGLSVLTFLRPLTFLELDDPSELIEDAANLARIEGLQAHALSAEARRRTSSARDR